jgi:hypothetical protein
MRAFMISGLGLLVLVSGCSSSDTTTLSDTGGSGAQANDASTPDGSAGTAGTGGTGGGAAGTSGSAGAAGGTGGTGGGGTGGTGGTGGATGGTAGATGGTGGGTTGSGDPCVSDSECISGTTCQVLPNPSQSALELRCAPILGPNGTGVACSQNSDCRAGQCLHGKCSAPCTTYDDCTQAGTCQSETITVGTLSGSFDMCVVLPCPNTAACDPGEYCTELMQEGQLLVPYCRQGNAGGDPTGTFCSSGASCASLSCPNWLGFCTEVCSTDSDCVATTKQACVDVFNNGSSVVAACAPACAKVSECPTGTTCMIARDSANNKNRFICGPGWGTDPVGTNCMVENKCASGLCIQNYANGQIVDAICTAPCVTGADCPSGYQVCTDVQMNTPSGTGTQTIRMCNRP